MKKSQDQELSMSRRAFVRKSACASLGFTGLVNSLSHLMLTNNALAQSVPNGEYKALVVIFLFGGNDSNNMLIPQLGHPEYDNYKSGRGNLGILDENDGDFQGSAGEGSLPIKESGYGLHHKLQDVVTLFDNDDLAFVANVGTLVEPITRDQFLAGSTPVPPQLFSHNSQQVEWQSSLSGQPFQSGWGGRIADLLHDNGFAGDKVSLSVSISGINSLQVGGDVVQYTVTPQGAIPLANYGSDLDPYDAALNANGTYTNADEGDRLQAFHKIHNYSRQQLLESAYTDVVNNSLSSGDVIREAFDTFALDPSSPLLDAAFANANSGLGQQLKTIAKLVSTRSVLGNQRQIFFCSIGGYDTHADQIPEHENLMEELNASLSAFSNGLKALGVNDNVLTMTHSDFARTLTPNKDDASVAGSDHGWGGHHIVMGGPVKGGQIYGTFPSLELGQNQDSSAGRGRWIPTTSVDQYSAIAAKWLGVDSNSMEAIFPNLPNFNDPFDVNGSANLDYVDFTV